MQTYQIEIDPSALVHDGVQYEPVAFRGQKRGEKYIDRFGSVMEAERDCSCSSPRLIVRPVWQWPEWLGGAAIARNVSGGTYWHSAQPTKSGVGNYAANGYCLAMACLASLLPSFAPPPLKPGEIVMNPKCKPTNESE